MAFKEVQRKGGHQQLLLGHSPMMSAFCNYLSILSVLLDWESVSCIKEEGQLHQRILLGMWLRNAQVQPGREAAHREVNFMCNLHTGGCPPGFFLP